MKRLLLRFVLAAGGVLFALVVAELGLRVFAPQADYVLDFGDIYEPDPETGYRLRPGAVVAGDSYRINSLGFRDREHPVRKPDGTFRVLVLGDSYTFGSVPLDDVYTKVAERALEASRPEGEPRIDVLSVGVPGWGTVEELVWLRERGLSLDPDLVVLGFFVGNDVNDNRELGELVPLGGTLVTREQAGFHGTPRGRLWFRARVVAHRFHLYRLGRNAAHRARIEKRRTNVANRPDEADTAEIETNSDGTYRMYSNRMIAFRSPVPKWFQGGWSETRRALAEMKLLLGDVPFAVFVIPEQVQVNPHLLERIRSDIGDEEMAAHDMELPQKRLREWGQELGFEVLDVLPPMAVRGAEEMFYYPHDAHWNVPGNRLGGEWLAAQLRARGLVPGTP